MKRPQLEELVERIAALESTVRGTADAARLDARLEAIEKAVLRLRDEHGGTAEIDAAVRRCSELVGEHVPAGARLAVASEGDAGLFAIEHWPSVSFPDTAGTGGEHRLDHSAAAIAQLEAQRAHGTRFLLLPEPARTMMQRLPELSEHLLGRYAIVADEPGAGLLLDLGVRRVEDGTERTLAEELDRLADRDRYAPILDWTDLDLAPLAVGRNLFMPPADDGELPYLDATIEVVVVDDPARLEEARRVASGAVLRVGRRQSGGVEVIEVEQVRPAGDQAVVPVLVVVGETEPDDPWLARVEEAAGERVAVEVIASDGRRMEASDADVVVLVERGVLPLPGCIEALASTLASGAQAQAAAVKLLGANGVIEAAGRTVFADGSVAEIAAGCASIAAPWHEYVRPVCAAAGILALRASAAAEVWTDGGSLLGLSGRLWAAGHRLLFQPDAGAVRAIGPDRRDEEGEPGIEDWAAALSDRPERPVPLDERAWRLLLARDDVEACWR